MREAAFFGMSVIRRSGKGRQTLSRNMVERRRRLKMTQERLGELADMHPTYISSVERAKRNIGIDGIERLAKALKTTISGLLKDSQK